VRIIPTLGEILQAQGVSRRGFMKYCAATASLLALPPTMVPRIANALEQARRPSVIWLSFQDITRCRLPPATPQKLLVTPP
jgi:hydrogenase small subunit